MELTLRGYELSLTVRRSRVKSKREKEPIMQQGVAPNRRAEHRHLCAAGGRYLVPSR
jgi:hypothetical protein